MPQERCHISSEGKKKGHSPVFFCVGTLRRCRRCRRRARRCRLLAVVGYRGGWSISEVEVDLVIVILLLRLFLVLCLCGIPSALVLTLTGILSTVIRTAASRGLHGGELVRL